MDRHIKLAESINGWQIVEDEQTGRVGRVFIVRRDGNPHQLRALKLCRDEHFETSRRAIVEEARRLEHSKVPSRMPRLVERGEWRGLPYAVMELIDCIDYPIPANGYRKFAVETFDALSDLHAADILHCDITPRHLGRKAGRIAFIDFDNAHTHREAAENRYCIGTDPYIAPEVASRGEISEQSDIYSLAMILIERCPKKLRDCFEPVLRECLRPEPKDRPRSATEVAEQFRTCRPPHHRFKTVVKWTAIAVGSVMLAYAGIMFANYQKRRSSIRNRSIAIIEAEAEFNLGCNCCSNGDVTNAIRHLRTAGRLGCERAKVILRQLNTQPQRQSQHEPSHQHSSPQHSGQHP